MSNIYLVGTEYESSYGYRYLSPIGLYDSEYDACAAILRHKKRHIWNSEYRIIKMRVGVDYSTSDDHFLRLTRESVTPEVSEWLDTFVNNIYADDDFIRCMTDDERKFAIAMDTWDVMDRMINCNYWHPALGDTTRQIQSAILERDEFLRTGKLPDNDYDND